MVVPPVLHECLLRIVLPAVVPAILDFAAEMMIGPTIEHTPTNSHSEHARGCSLGIGVGVEAGSSFVLNIPVAPIVDKT